MVNYLVYAFDYPKNFHSDFVYRYEKVLHLLEENEEISKNYKIIKPEKMELEDFEIVHYKGYLKELKEISKKKRKS